MHTREYELDAVGDEDLEDRHHKHILLNQKEHGMTLTTARFAKSGPHKHAHMGSGGMAVLKQRQIKTSQ
jgi:hypothetical protein